MLQVEGNENVAPPPKIDFTSAVQNIPLKKHLNRERIAKASRELHRSIEPQEKVTKFFKRKTESKIRIYPGN